MHIACRIAKISRPMFPFEAEFYGCIDLKKSLSQIFPVLISYSHASLEIVIKFPKRISQKYQINPRSLTDCDVINFRFHNKIECLGCQKLMFHVKHLWVIKLHRSLLSRKENLTQRASFPSTRSILFFCIMSVYSYLRLFSARLWGFARVKRKQNAYDCETVNTKYW